MKNETEPFSFRTITLTGLIRRFWRQVIFTWFNVVLESFALICLPLVIGWSVDGLLTKDLTGLYQLGGLCLVLLFFGTIRRFYDTRTYGAIYTTIANELVTKEQQQNSKLSKISARTQLLWEFISFMEESIPEIVQQVIGLFGTLLIIVFIDFNIFIACLLGIGLTFFVYTISQRTIYRLTKAENNELERQIDVLSSRKNKKIQNHFSRLIKWRIKLSDLETWNYSAIWIGLTAVLIYAIVSSTSSSTITFGKIISIVMYVFEFIESVMTFPLFYQQLIRLKEISHRLEEQASFP